jgi:hypothetical protein
MAKNQRTIYRRARERHRALFDAWVQRCRDRECREFDVRIEKLATIKKAGRCGQ